MKKLLLALLILSPITTLAFEVSNFSYTTSVFNENQKFNVEFDCTGDCTYKEVAILDPNGVTIGDWYQGTQAETFRELLEGGCLDDPAYNGVIPEGTYTLVPVTDTFTDNDWIYDCTTPELENITTLFPDNVYTVNYSPQATTAGLNLILLAIGIWFGYAVMKGLF